uniref:Uncharacterized protein n=1 Tax=Arundo donax TaxID=35708 RepID=A0A0A8YE69_ARUDO
MAVTGDQHKNKNCPGLLSFFKRCHLYNVTMHMSGQHVRHSVYSF